MGLQKTPSREQVDFSSVHSCFSRFCRELFSRSADVPHVRFCGFLTRPVFWKTCITLTVPFEISKGKLSRLRGRTNMDQDNDKPRISILRRLALKRSEQTDQDQPPVELTPAMPELGTAPCPVCGHKVAVFVTRTKRPFINCGFCSARIFYNGSRSMQLLQRQIKGSTKTIVRTNERQAAQTDKSPTKSGIVGSSTLVESDRNAELLEIRRQNIGRRRRNRGTSGSPKASPLKSEWSMASMATTL